MAQPLILAWETEIGSSSWVWGQPSLQGEFQASQGCTRSLFIKTNYLKHQTHTHTNQLKDKMNEK